MTLTSAPRQNCLRLRIRSSLLFVGLFIAVLGTTQLGEFSHGVADAATGLVAAYGLNEGTGTTTADNSGSGQPGTLTNTTWTTAGRYGNALTFNGTSSRVNVADAASLDLTTGMTLEAWVFPTTSTGWRTVVMKERSGGFAYALYANNNAARPAVQVRIGGTNITLAGTAALPVNTWSHLAATYDATTLQLYVNGIQVASRATTGALTTTTNPLRLGGTTTLAGRFFSGQIDEVRIYNRALSPTELQADMASPIGAPDTTPPTVTGRTPAPGATGVAVGTTVTATFSEALDPTTVTTSTVTLQAGSTTVPATVSYNSATFTATLTPSSPLTTNTLYTATVRGGTTDPRVKDGRGTPWRAPLTWTFTTGTAAAPTCPCTLWPNTATPANPSDPEGAALELGVKFRASVSGFLTGIRFYKGTTNTGTHVGSLWTSTGTLLAQVTFTNETASGWQQATFATPVAITANTTYVASYHTNVGHYAGDNDYFATTGVTTGPLTALRDGVDGGNGVYRDGATSVFPNQTYQIEQLLGGCGVRHHAWPRHHPAHGDRPDPRPRGHGGRGRDHRHRHLQRGAGPDHGHHEHRHPPGGEHDGPRHGELQQQRPSRPPSPRVAPWRRTPSTPPPCGAGPPIRGSRTSAGNALASTLTWTFTTGTADTTPPTVTGQTPASGATGVAVGTTVTATFSEALDPTTVTTSTVTLQAGSTTVPATVSYNSSTFTATLTPSSPLAASTLYTATVRGGATDPRVKDTAGNALASTLTWSFTTQTALPQGPGGPILVITSAANPFTSYVAEILRAEGLNAFATADIATVSAATLAAYDVVILGEMPLTAAQVSLLTTWVTGGGNLIALRPDKQLAGLLGLSDAGSTLANAYLLINTASGPGVGLVAQTIQFHGTADRYTLNGATSVATLYSTATTATTNPAVTLRSVGTTGGHAAAFTYDLARSVVYTRQGNPAWAGQERDADVTNVIKSNDLFYGNASFDPQPDWVDLTKVAIPQADEQQRLLVNLLLQMNADRKPLPRFWYFPRNLEAVVVLTGDDHGNGGTPGPLRPPTSRRARRAVPWTTGSASGAPRTSTRARRSPTPRRRPTPPRASRSACT